MITIKKGREYRSHWKGAYVKSNNIMEAKAMAAILSGHPLLLEMQSIEGLSHHFEYDASTGNAYVCIYDKEAMKEHYLPEWDDLIPLSDYDQVESAIKTIRGLFHG